MGGVSNPILLMVLLSIVFSSASATSFINNGLFERYSKLKLLSECLGKVTVARWRQQVITASRECEQDPPFIAALLHQIPSLAFQQQQPPQYFVPNIPPANHYLFPSQHRPYYVTAPQNYKTYFYLRQSTPSVVYQQRSHLPVALGNQYVSPTVGFPTSYKPLPVNPIRSVVYTEDSSSEEQTDFISNPPTRIVGNKPLARQRDSYTNPELKYEETEQYFNEQLALRQNQPSQLPLYNHKIPIQPSRPYNPASRLQKREANPGWYNGNNNRDGPTKEEKLRSLLRNRVTDRVSNMTCVMKALKMLNDNLEPNVPFLEDSLLELPIANDLYEELKSGIDYCQSARSCRFDRPMIHEIPIKTEFSSSLEFFKCFGKERLRSCLKANVAGMVKLMEREHVVDPISGFYEPESHTSTAVGELEDLLAGNTGHFVDMLLL